MSGERCVARRRAPSSTDGATLDGEQEAAVKPEVSHISLKVTLPLLPSRLRHLPTHATSFQIAGVNFPELLIKVKRSVLTLIILPVPALR